MAAFNCFVAFFLVTLANSATVKERIYLQEIIRDIKAVLVRHKMDSCAKSVPNIFKKGAASFCKAAKVLGNEQFCPNVNGSIFLLKIRLNIENLATEDCIIEKELPEMLPKDFLDSLKDFACNQMKIYLF